MHCCSEPEFPSRGRIGQLLSLGGAVLLIRSKNVTFLADHLDADGSGLRAQRVLPIGSGDPAHLPPGRRWLGLIIMPLSRTFIPALAGPHPWAWDGRGGGGALDEPIRAIGFLPSINRLPLRLPCSITEPNIQRAPSK